MKNRRAFTLVELLVVIGILLLLTAMVVYAFNLNAGGDRIRSAGRTTQSAFLGAKDRALHAKDRRGLRLLHDSSDQSLCNGFVYLQPIENQVYALHSIQLERRDTTSDGTADSPEVVIVRGHTASPPTVDWYNLQNYFASPPRIRIPEGTGQWYTFTWDTSGTYNFTAATPFLQLTTPFPDAGVPSPTVIAHGWSTSTNTSCELEMAPEILPNHAPIQLPSGVVIDLYWSRIPASWYEQQSIADTAAIPAGFVFESDDPSNAANQIIRKYSAAMDIMYSPRGMVTGPISALGPIYLLLNDIQDATMNLNPIDAANKGEKRVLAIMPQTGHCQTYEIDPTDTTPADGIADDLFRFAKLGSRAGN